MIDVTIFSSSALYEELTCEVNMAVRFDLDSFLEDVTRAYGEGSSAESDSGDLCAYYIGARLYKTVRTVITEGGNTLETVRHRPLDDGHTIDDPREAVVVNGGYYQQKATHRCPECGRVILPGPAVLAEGMWYHEQCGESARGFAALKRESEARIQVARVQAAGLQNRLTAAQIESTEANTRALEQRTVLEKQRFDLEKDHAVERLGMERQTAGDKSRTVESQLCSEELDRTLKEDGFKIQSFIQLTDLLGRLEKEGHVPEGTVKKLLPRRVAERLLP